MKDLRTPIGLFFLILGLILIGMGFLSPDSHAPLVTINVNLYSGLAMVLFGGLMLLLARRAT